VHGIQHDRSDHTQSDERRKEGEKPGSTPVPKNEEQTKMQYKTRRPEKEIQTSKKHPRVSFQGGEPRASAELAV
jgi:hypothetical protein